MLPQLISPSQQGFVRGRSIDKTITILRSILDMSAEDATKAWTDCPAVLCLDLRKAYDTLDRTFLQRVLRAYGFSDQFLNVIRTLYEGTTAQFLVNGKLSTEWSVESGIRQGCPLAPLLFILAVDTLGQAINKNPELQGIAIPGAPTGHHKFSAFVDDSTIFMNSLHELDTVKRILRTFGEVSGLTVQPHKTILIGLKTHSTPSRWDGFPVLHPAETTRQLGSWVGNMIVVKRKVGNTDRKNTTQTPHSNYYQ